jgi:L-ascorbate metabolism protein UlaG (beta-lactamase superfamily)
VPPDTYDDGFLEVACCGRSDAPVELTYLGVGGWIVRKAGGAILTAPLFSNPSLLDVGLGAIASDPDRIEANLPDVSDVGAIVVGHGHYDHLMDVPYIARHRAPRALVYGNATTAHQLAPFGLGDRVRVVEPLAGTVERPGEWVEVARGFRLMPLLSDHAPHLAGVTLYAGNRTRDMAREPRAADEWLDGTTLAFLIDVLNEDGSVGLRIYYQDAVAAPPYGLAPRLADSVDVDVAIVVPATYAEVSWHPEALMESLRPRHVLLGHWEDFFEPPSRPPEPVPFTLLPDFVARLERALPEGAEWHLPVAGTRFRFR